MRLGTQLLKNLYTKTVVSMSDDINLDASWPEIFDALNTIARTQDDGISLRNAYQGNMDKKRL
jgi:hypothetical protein